jgi:hypothetical protein
MVQRCGTLLQVVAVAVEVTGQVPAFRLSQAGETNGFPCDRLCLGENVRSDLSHSRARQG